MFRIPAQLYRKAGVFQLRFYSSCGHTSVNLYKHVCINMCLYKHTHTHIVFEKVWLQSRDPPASASEVLGLYPHLAQFMHFFCSIPILFSSTLEVEAGG